MTILDYKGFEAVNKIMQNYNQYAYALSNLKKQDEEVRSEVQGFKHSQILGTYDDEHDDLFRAREVEPKQELSKEPLPF